MESLVISMFILLSTPYLAFSPGCHTRGVSLNSWMVTQGCRFVDFCDLNKNIRKSVLPWPCRANTDTDVTVPREYRSFYKKTFEISAVIVCTAPQPCRSDSHVNFLLKNCPILPCRDRAVFTVIRKPHGAVGRIFEYCQYFYRNYDYDMARPLQVHSHMETALV